MRTVVPVFHHPEDPVWGSKEGKNLLEAFLGRFSSSACTVATSSRDVVELAGRIGAHGVLVDLPDHADGPFMPGFAAAVGCLGEPDPEEVFVFLDHRNPLLEVSDMESAVRLFHSSSATTVFTVVSPRDHPCQFSRYSRVLAMGLIHLLDQRGQCLLPLSMPFQYDWLGRAMDDPDAGRYRFAPGSEGPVLNAVRSEAGPLWSIRRVGLGAAQLEMPVPPNVTTPPGHSLVGMSWRVADGPGRPFLFRENESGRMLLDTELASDSNGSASAVLIPFEETGAHPERGFSLRLDPATGTAAFDCHFPRLNGFAYALLGDAEGYYCDMVEPYEPDCGFWRVEKPSLERISSQTGKPIIGRQDFPEVWAFDGSVLVVSGAALRSMKNSCDLMNEAVPYPLPQSRQITVDSHFSLLALKARREAQGDA